ncbi:hypothetical protein SAMN05444363_0639 [Flavobacterium terrae]|uniref:Uncharacterized protein n=1 Tax=Flavobacterium terrae TaxID=415425 RepID=A0A1M6BAD4_9FLAO|nr:hypothetical protein SAMN05444363_0639 [Flavobacterium terrae]
MVLQQQNVLSKTNHKQTKFQKRLPNEGVFLLEETKSDKIL